MEKERIEQIFQHLPKRAIAVLAAGVTLTMLSGCAKKEVPVEVVPTDPAIISTLRPLPSGTILNGTKEDEKEEETTKKEAPKASVTEDTKSPENNIEVEVPVITEVPVEIESPVEVPVIEEIPISNVAVVNPDYPYAATITIPLNNGTNPAVSFATSKEAGKETVFISSNTAKICGVVVTQSLIDTLSQDPSIQTLEFEGCQIDTLSIQNSRVNALYLWNTYVRQIGACNVGANFTLTLHHATLGDPTSLRNLPTCTTCTAIGISSTCLSSIKELSSLQTLILKQLDIPSFDFINNTGVKTLYIESCTMGCVPLTSQNLKTFSAFDVDLGDLSFLSSSSVQDVNFRSCSFCNIESLDYSSVLSVKVNDFYASRTNRYNSFQPDLLSLYGEDVYTLELGL